MKKDLLFYNEYEQFYRFAEESEAFKEFCNEAYGADFSQDGFSDIKQINKIVPYIKESNAHILDVGCGNGKMLEFLRSETGAYIHGFDYSEKSIESAIASLKDADFRVGVIGEMDYPEKSFDLIIAMDSIYFAKDMKSFISQARSWLKPGGVFFVAYQEGDVMEKTVNSDSTVFADAMQKLGWKYSVEDISLDSYEMLKKKREVAMKYRDSFGKEGNGMWGDMLIAQTDYILQGKEEYLKNLARYIYVAIK